MKLVDALHQINTGLSEPVKYHQILAAAREGTIPVHRNNAGTRWAVDPADLPKIRANLAGGSAQ
ncbi:MAG: hypothetical protein WDN69_05085 [Aliidongia sp.]